MTAKDDTRDKTAGQPEAEAGAGAETMSALRRRTAKARAERAARLAENLRANLGRRKQQTRGRDDKGES